MLFVQTFLARCGVAFPWYGVEPDATRRFEDDLHRWMVPSHAILDQRGEHGAAQARLGPAHREKTREWVRAMIGPQSIPAMTLGPQRLMTFISSAEGSRG